VREATLIGDRIARWQRPLLAAAGAFSAVTLCWIMWGLLTPGDFFANDNPLVFVSLPVALVVGAWLAHKARRRTRYVVFALSLTCAAFWIFVPSGWWASAPPRGGEIQLSR
jgi:hypothetical protein